MGTFNYLLRNNSIVFNFQYGLNNRLRKCSTGYKVAKTSNWLDSQNIKSVLAENNVNGTYTPQQVNEKLKDFKDLFLKEYDSLKEQGEIITNEILRDCAKRLLLTKTTTKQKKQLGFFEYFDLFVQDSESGKRKHRRKQISQGTIKTYGTTKTFLEDFVKYRKKPIYFSAIDKEFYDELDSYADDIRDLSLNYKGKHIKVFNTFLNYIKTVKKVKLINYNASDFIVESERIEEIALTLDELDKIYKVDLSHSELLNRARDLFIIGAYTGLRVSDFGALTINNIITVDGIECFDTKIKKRNSEETILIPLSSRVKEIINRNNGLPKTMLPQQINDNIKTVGELAKLNKEVSITKTIGGVKVTTNHYQYELIKTHTARRSFCTNAYLKGVDSITIMAISQHTTEINFLNYIKVPAKEHAKRLANHSFFKLI